MRVMQNIETCACYEGEHFLCRGTHMHRVCGPERSIEWVRTRLELLRKRKRVTCLSLLRLSLLLMRLSWTTFSRSWCNACCEALIRWCSYSSRLTWSQIQTRKLVKAKFTYDDTAKSIEKQIEAAEQRDFTTTSRGKKQPWKFRWQ